MSIWTTKRIQHDPHPIKVAFDKDIAAQELFSVSVFQEKHGETEYYDLSEYFDGSVCIDADSIALGLKAKPPIPDEVDASLYFITDMKVRTAGIIIEDHISHYLKIGFNSVPRGQLFESIIQRGGYHLASIKGKQDENNGD